MRLLPVLPVRFPSFAAALRSWLPLGVLVVPLVLAACGDGEGTATPTATATESTTATASPTATATASATPTETATPTAAAGDVRALDFADPSVIGPLIDHFGGGEVEPERVEYVDLTADGVDEALVFVASGGTQGDLGAAIVTENGGKAEVLHFIDIPGRIEVRFGDVGLGIVAALEPVYAEGDPECCPSQLRETVIQWDGAAFVVVSEQVVDNPDA